MSKFKNDIRLVIIVTGDLLYPCNNVNTRVLNTINKEFLFTVLLERFCILTVRIESTRICINTRMSDAQSSPWLDAWHDPLAGIKTTTQCVRLGADLFADGDNKLLICDQSKKLKVYRGTAQAMETDLLDFPVAQCATYTELASVCGLVSFYFYCFVSHWFAFLYMYLYSIAKNSFDRSCCRLSCVCLSAASAIQKGRH